MKHSMHGFFVNVLDRTAASQFDLGTCLITLAVLTSLVPLIRPGASSTNLRLENQ